MPSVTNNIYRGVEGTVKKVPAELPTSLRPKEILLKITHASLCGTDVHFISHGIALGHEGVGIVQEIGSEVTQFKIGDRAGAGYLRDVTPSPTSWKPI
jgi:threonine dehydrogenase-like Zn-dependent dehydrogenase